ncbi:MAG: PEP-CTERM sorting domain-containing protein [Terrimicrobiaceae bacterium]
MKTHRFPLLVLLSLSALATDFASATPVTLNIDSSFEGLATTNQSPFATGVFRIGWFDAGINDGQISIYFNSGNLAAIEARFHQMASVLDLNSFGPGLPYTSINLVDDGDTVGLAAYQAEGAGETIYGWLLSDGSGSPYLSSEQAIVASDIFFPTAVDDLAYTDFSATFGTDSFAPGIHAVVGEIQIVMPGSGIDLNAGSPADGLGLNGGEKVLVAAAAVPEPTTYALFGLAAFGALYFRLRLPLLRGLEGSDGGEAAILRCRHQKVGTTAGLDLG